MCTPPDIYSQSSRGSTYVSSEELKTKSNVGDMVSGEGSRRTWAFRPRLITSGIDRSSNTSRGGSVSVCVFVCLLVRGRKHERSICFGQARRAQLVRFPRAGISLLYRCYQDLTGTRYQGWYHIVQVLVPAMGLYSHTLLIVDNQQTAQDFIQRLFLAPLAFFVSTRIVHAVQLYSQFSISKIPFWELRRVILLKMGS
jgi:hypothetical protein